MEAYRYLSGIYDMMMEDVDYDAWTAYLDGMLRRAGAKRIFEAACGTGAISRRLFTLGYDVVASDISGAMLRIAAEEARREGCGARFVRQDMRHIEVARPMDAVVCACDGVNYVDTDGVRSFAAGAFAALRPGGLLLFDVSTRHKLRDIMDGQVYFDDADDAACIWQNRYDEDRSALTMDVTLFIRNGEWFERSRERHVQYAHDTDVLLGIMREAGFSRAEAYEAFTEHAPSEDAQRVQFLCAR